MFTNINLLTARNSCLFELLLCIAVCNPQIVSASLVEMPKVSVTVQSDMDFLRYSAVAGHSPHFDASIDIPGWPAGMSEGDVYFGVFLPRSDKPLVWVQEGDAVRLQETLAPIAKIPHGTERYTFNLVHFLGKRIQYTFTGDEPSGMYLIFALIVRPDADPLNAENWLGMSMVPLFFTP